MVRTLWIFAWIAALGFAAAWLADRPGGLTITWLGWEVETSFAVALVIAGTGMAVLLGLGRLVGRLMGLPAAVSGTVRHRRQARRLEAITRGLIAAAAGDGQSARRLAAQARPGKTVLSPAERTLHRLLTAQAAQLNGDEAEAEAQFQAMLAEPDTSETEFLGLRGLLALAMRHGDSTAARDFAARALALRPKSDWAFRTLFDLQAEAGLWREALATLEAGRKADLVPPDLFHRQQAVLLTASAAADERAGRLDRAERDARKAFRLLPSLTPAALLAARRALAAGHRWKAAGILEEAWRAAPHPALAEAYGALEPHESAHDRAKRLSGLAEMMPDHMESRLLLAALAISTRDWSAARRALAPLASATPTARVCALMAEVEQGEHGNVGAAREWLARAVTAPPEPDWMRSSFDFDTRDWAELAQRLGQPNQPWPPALDPALFARQAPTVTLYSAPAEAPDPEADTPEKRAASERGGEHGAAGPAPRQPVVIVEAPEAVDHAPAADPPSPRRRAAAAMRSSGWRLSRRQGLSLSRHKIWSPKKLKPSRPVNVTAPASRILGSGRKHAKSTAPLRSPAKTRPLRTSSTLADIPPPPDDPGPDYDGDA